jgi:hypothetical protein
MHQFISALETFNSAELRYLTLQSDNGNNLLHVGALLNEYEFMRCILKTLQIDVNAVNHLGDTALHLSLIAAENNGICIFSFVIIAIWGQRTNIYHIYELAHVFPCL